MLRGGRFAYETAGCRWSLLGAQTVLPKGSKRRVVGGRVAKPHTRWVGYLHFKQHRLKEERVRGRKIERDMSWKRVRGKPFFWIVFRQLVPTKYALYAKLSLCFTWQWQWLYFPLVCCLGACGSFSPFVRLNTYIMVVSGALWKVGETCSSGTSHLDIVFDGCACITDEYLQESETTVLFNHCKIKPTTNTSHAGQRHMSSSKHEWVLLCMKLADLS